MTLISCDVCKKNIPGARKDVNYVTILDKDLCMPCDAKLQETTKRYAMAHTPYGYLDYWAMLQKNLERMSKR
jgi:hypothetical protein